MKKIFLVLILMLSSHAFAGDYTLDAAHSSVEFSIKHLGLFPVKGKFGKFSVDVDVDEAKQMIKSVVVKVDVDTINTNNEDRDAHLKSKDFFNVRNEEYDINKKYRHIVFKGKNIPFSSKFAPGKLKILKTNKKVNLKADINTLKDKEGSIAHLGAAISGVLKRQDYGLTWQKEGTGLVAKAAGKFVGDDVTLNVNILLKKAKSKKKSKK